MRVTVPLIAGLTSGALLLAPGVASAELYWANASDGTIGRSANDGTDVNQSFITGAATPAGLVATPTHLYWIDQTFTSIGRARRDGTKVEPTFVPVSVQPFGITATTTHLYWTNTATGTIGRVRLDGAGVDPDFITGLKAPYGIVAYNRRLYWADYGDNTIGRANLDGSRIEDDFITGANLPVMITARGSRLYWTNAGTSTIARGNTDGTGVSQSFLSGIGKVIGITANSSHLFWTSGSLDNTIGRSRLGGSSAVPSFITGAKMPYGIDEFTSVPATVRAQAKKRRSRLQVTISPRLAVGQQWRFRVQKRAKGAWRLLPRTYRTRGAAHIRTLNLRKGVYRVRVLPGFGYLAATSGRVRLRR